MKPLLVCQIEAMFSMYMNIILNKKHYNSSPFYQTLLVILFMRQFISCLNMNF